MLNKKINKLNKKINSKIPEIHPPLNKKALINQSPLIIKKKFKLMKNKSKKKLKNMLLDCLEEIKKLPIQIRLILK